MLILASTSPRRQELMRLITPDFTVCTRDTDESLPPGTPPREAVEQLALRKARAVAQSHPGDTVIGADTVVALDQRLLGKPDNESQAAEMLNALSGRTHHVYTGVAVLHPGGEEVFAEETSVDFIRLTHLQINRYIETGEPMDKAGAYGIQGAGALFIRKISGDFYNVMGLPVCRLNALFFQLSQTYFNIS